MFKIDYSENMSMIKGDSIQFAISLNDNDIVKISFEIMDKNESTLFEISSFKKRDIYHLFEVPEGTLNLEPNDYFYRIKVELSGKQCYNLFDKREFKIY